MIIVRLWGGLGNQMFQYAAGRNIALRNNTILKLDIEHGFINDFYQRKYSLNHFNIQENVAQNYEIPKSILKCDSSNKIFARIKRQIFTRISLDSYHIEREKNISFNENVFIPREKQYLWGYWQSEKYFSDIPEIVRNEFTIKNPLIGKNLDLAEQMQNSNSVGIHIRRLLGISSGIVTSSHHKLHGVLSNDYYLKALNFIKERYSNVRIYVFSDQPDWARQNFHDTMPYTIIDHNDDNHNYEDLRLMSLCKHQIIANSTFSWWAAWLNKNTSKIVVAPINWAVKDKFNQNDIIPSNWIRF